MMNHSIKKALLVLLISAGLAGQVQGSTVSAVQVENARAAQMLKILRSAPALGAHITPVRIAGVLLAVGGGWLVGKYFASKHFGAIQPQVAQPVAPSADRVEQGRGGAAVGSNVTVNQEGHRDRMAVISEEDGDDDDSGSGSDND